MTLVAASLSHPQRCRAYSTSAKQLGLISALYAWAWLERGFHKGNGCSPGEEGLSAAPSWETPTTMKVAMQHKLLVCFIFEACIYSPINMWAQNQDHLRDPTRPALLRAEAPYCVRSCTGAKPAPRSGGLRQPKTIYILSLWTSYCGIFHEGTEKLPPLASERIRWAWARRSPSDSTGQCKRPLI